jgi:hypothetical protein
MKPAKCSYTKQPCVIHTKANEIDPFECYESCGLCNTKRKMVDFTRLIEVIRKII